MLEEKKIPNDSLNKSNILCVYTNFLIVNKNLGWRIHEYFNSFRFLFKLELILLSNLKLKDYSFKYYYPFFIKKKISINKKNTFFQFNY